MNYSAVMCMFADTAKDSKGRNIGLSVLLLVSYSFLEDLGCADDLKSTLGVMRHACLISARFLSINLVPRVA